MTSTCSPSSTSIYIHTYICGDRDKIKMASRVVAAVATLGLTTSTLSRVSPLFHRRPGAFRGLGVISEGGTGTTGAPRVKGVNPNPDSLCYAGAARQRLIRERPHSPSRLPRSRIASRVNSKAVGCGVCGLTQAPSPPLPSSDLTWAISLGEERQKVTFGRRRFFALWLIQTLCVAKCPLSTHVKPGVKLHTKVYPEFGIHCYPLDSVDPEFIWRASLVNPLDSFGFTYRDS